LSFVCYVGDARSHVVCPLCVTVGASVSLVVFVFLVVAEKIVCVHV
jgi:hypothetical protein